MNNPDPSIQRFINTHLETLTRQLNYLTESISEYIRDSLVLSDLANDELMNLTILLNNDTLALENEVNRIGNLLEAMGRRDINERAIRLRRRSIMRIQKNRREIRRRGLIH
jgi:hypothetical protein